MVTTFSGQLVLHFFVGFAFALLVAWPWLKSCRRRHIFHFGGNHPLSLGNTGLWTMWYGFALAIEIGTSMLTHKIYVEWALSPFQAVAFVCGVFTLDRLAMMWEPANMYSPVPKNITAEAKLVEIAPEPEPIVPAPEVKSLPPAETPSPSWLRSILHRTTKDVVSTPQTVAESVKESLQERRERKAVREKAQKELAEEQRKERQNRLNDILDKF